MAILSRDGPLANGIATARQKWILRGELIIHLGVCLLAISTFTYAMTWTVPAVTQEWTPLCQCLIVIAGCWLVVGVLGHNLMLRARTSDPRDWLPLYEKANVELKDSKSDLTTKEECHENFEENEVQVEPEKVNEDSSSNAWHECTICQIQVPPQTWHCKVCGICVLRRCHHCIFAGVCVGERNQVNFIGFLLYACIGSLAALVFGIWSNVQQDTPIWKSILKAVMPLYLFYEFDSTNAMCAAMLGFAALTGVGFLKYFGIALLGLTAYQAEKNAGEGKEFSYKALQKFLGPFPIAKILVPFFQPTNIKYEKKY